MALVVDEFYDELAKLFILSLYFLGIGVFAVLINSLGEAKIFSY